MHRRPAHPHGTMFRPGLPVIYNTTGILYHPRLDAAHVLARRIQQQLDPRVHRTWSASAWDEAAPVRMKDTDLLVCIGGDGTMLRAARLAIPGQVPIIGVNMGRIGFL